MGAPSETTADEDELAPTVDAERGAPTVPLELRKGAVLGGAYRVLRRLGQGGMGTVYLVEHTELGRRFAAKVVSRALSESAAQRLLNEAKVTSGIDHENIVDVVNLGRQPDGAIFVIMELLEGEDLGRRLDRQLEEEDGDPWLPDEELQAYVPQMLDGLAAAHAAGVIHRDLKPDNVFLARRDDGRVILKLLDFGIAKNVEPDGDQRLTRTGQIIGTPLYMAPEQARNMSDADVRADIYSVGVILYEMITGAPPFEADTLFDLILQHATEPPVP
ncbi:MAG: serine/threonine protein kinase, partial [Dehalococcoidia bacterium]|nr:serine/threonine protein kinase [Dehalococcoidia bacterium]